MNNRSRSSLSILVLGIIFGGCASGMHFEKLAVRNSQNLALLERGMSKQQVFDMMGFGAISLKSCSDPYCDWVESQPVKVEAFPPEDEITIDVLHYRTGSYLPKDDPDNFTPLVFINGELQGWGWTFWIDEAARYDISIIRDGFEIIED